MVRFHTQFYIHRLFCFFYPPKCLNVYVFVRNTHPHRAKSDPHVFKSVFLRYSHIQKGYKCYCLELNCFIISSNVTFFESNPYFETESHSFESDEDLLYPLVQHLVHNTTSLDITDQVSLPSKHGEPTKVYTNCTSIVSPSSVLDSISQSSENILPSDDVTPIFIYSSSDISNINFVTAF